MTAKAMDQRVCASCSPTSRTIDQCRVRDAGFAVVMADRDGAGADSALATTLITDSFTIHRLGDLVILVPNDMDYIPAINGLRQRVLGSTRPSGPRA